ncbi:hypothetical protein HUO14_03200 [Parasphingorhabdus flavimaris]|jgi:hypothetical protein|uniref:Uncharacterized protein n=1 Tax=Parasphingorhabdus flavimaris TaxID=266812 RepID=A0ABX2MZP5_9SPHN|nr:hypothetical protein [Parasphingorhabdus flavimaris]NVD26913.1 hypothetical protein [Parasphingorhabdus flavimaris]|tara:strand:- start:5620 stop:5937 length:318 start_codon:yes stop_codon:yes gene_type:complete
MTFKRPNGRPERDDQVTDTFINGKTCGLLILELKTNVSGVLRRTKFESKWMQKPFSQTGWKAVKTGGSNLSNAIFAPLAGVELSNYIFPIPNGEIQTEPLSIVPT